MERSGTSQPARVLLVEDLANVRAAIASEFEIDPDFEIVGQAGSLAEARIMLTGADVVILDLGLPDGSGIDLIPEIRTANPNACVIVLSASVDHALHAGAIQSGAAAVLDKLTHLGQLPQTVRRVLAGGRPQKDEPC